MDRDTCAIGRCRAMPVMTAWSVPICQPHWDQCCAETNDSHPWLKRKARREFADAMPPGPAPSKPEPKPKPKAVRVSPAPSRAVRVTGKPVRISP